MITFFIHAKPMMNGKVVELTVYEGTYKGDKVPMGSVSFEAPQWELFRELLIAGMRSTRVPVEMMDGTRPKIPADKVH